MTDRHKFSRIVESPSPEQQQPRYVWFRRGVLVVPCFAMIVAANAPPDLASFGFRNDKLNHALALAVLPPLTIWALPNTGPVPIFVGLALFNAGIEISQAVAGLGRTPDVMYPSGEGRDVMLIGAQAGFMRRALRRAVSSSTAGTR